MDAALIHIVRQVKPDLIQGWMYHGNIAAQLRVFFLKKNTYFMEYSLFG